MDIGAFESRGFNVTVTGGNNQQTLVNTAFATPLSVQVTSSYGEPVQGGVVTFSAPDSGASAGFPGGATATIDASGKASVSVTANGTAGNYLVGAAAGDSPDVLFNLTNLAGITLTPTTLPNGTYGTAYSQTLTATGGVGGPYTFTVTAGALPDGMTLASSGGLTGTPTAPGVFSFTVQAKDSDNHTGTQNYTLTIAQATPKLTVSDAGGTYNGDGFPATASAVGVDGQTPLFGTYSFTYYVDSGTSGTNLGHAVPTNAGTYTVVVQFTPSDSNYTATTAQTTFTITPADPTLTISTGGTYNGNPLSATGTALGVSGAPVAGNFSYTYYAGSSASGNPLPGAPTNAGTDTVVANFTSSDGNYTNATAQTTFTISPAKISYTIGNDTQAPGQPANLAADLPATFGTGINGETLDLTYSSTGDTRTAAVGTYPITAVVSDGTGLASNYSVQLTNGTLTVLAPGVTAVGSTLWIVGGTSSNDTVQIKPAGASKTGSTGIQVLATLNGVRTSTIYSQPFTAINIIGYGGNDSIQLADSLTINATVKAGNGNDNVVLGDGNNTVTLGDGNDTVQVGNGNNVVVTGNGHDSIQAGNGNNLIAAGLGQHTVRAGNGSNILIDGSVQLAQSGDSLRQVLDDWIAYGAEAANVDSIRARLLVTDNSNYANTLDAGSGLDWFWATYARDSLNIKPTDLLN